MRRPTIPKRETNIIKKWTIAHASHHSDFTDRKNDDKEPFMPYMIENWHIAGVQHFICRQFPKHETRDHNKIN